MTMRIKTALASLAIATMFTLGATSPASAFDLLEELLGGTKYDDGCGCSQKSGGHVQRCGTNCGGKGGVGHVQHGGGKGIAGHVQHGGGKGAHCSGPAQRGGCDGGKGGAFGGHVQHGGKSGGWNGGKGGSIGGHVQHIGGGKGAACSGPAQRGGCGDVKAGTKGVGGKSSHRIDLYGMMRAKMAGLKCKFAASDCDCVCSNDKGYDFDVKAGAYDDGKSFYVPAPVITEGIESVPVPGDPDPST